MSFRYRRKRTIRSLRRRRTALSGKASLAGVVPPDEHTVVIPCRFIQAAVLYALSYDEFIYTATHQIGDNTLIVPISGRKGKIFLCGGRSCLWTNVIAHCVTRQMPHRIYKAVSSHCDKVIQRGGFLTADTVGLPMPLTVAHGNARSLSRYSLPTRRTLSGSWRERSRGWESLWLRAICSFDTPV